MPPAPRSGAPLAVLEAEGHISREVGRGTFPRDAGPGPTRTALTAGQGEAARAGHWRRQRAARPRRCPVAFAPADVMAIRRMLEAVRDAAGGGLGDGRRLRRGWTAAWLHGSRRAAMTSSSCGTLALHRCIMAASHSPLLARLYAPSSRRPGTASSGATSSAAARRGNASASTRPITGSSSPPCGLGTPTRRSRPCARTWPGSAATCSTSQLSPVGRSCCDGPRLGTAPLRSGRDALAEPGERERVAVVDRHVAGARTARSGSRRRARLPPAARPGTPAPRRRGTIRPWSRRRSRSPAATAARRRSGGTIRTGSQSSQRCHTRGRSTPVARVERQLDGAVRRPPRSRRPRRAA